MNKSKKINICIIRNDKIGDMILTLPVIKAVKENNPYSDISVVCSKANSFLCKEVPFVDKYYVFDKNDNLISKMISILKFRKNSYDMIFNFSQSLETFLLLLSAKSIYKSNLAYLSRYGNPKFSKIFQRLFSKILSIDNVNINRNKFFKNKLNFHQTEIMYQQIKKKIDVKKPTSFQLIPPKIHNLEIFQKRILIHLSSRWIDNNYSEECFLELLTKIRDHFGKIYLTTDDSSNTSFQKIYQFYKKYDDTNLYKLSKNNQSIIILDKLNFQNWREVIIKSKLVLTYECGCVHVTSMSNVPLLVVYDYENQPYMINKEYAPLTNNYEKVIANQQMINQEVMLKLKKMKTNIFDKI